MPQPIPDEERERIIAAFATGASCNQIAKEFGRAPSTISRLAAKAGHSWQQSHITRAHEAKAAYDAERRAKLILTCVESAEKLATQMFAPTLVYNFGGKDNTYNEAEISEPGFRDKQAIANAISALMRTVKDIEAREQASGGTGQLDDIRAAIRRDAERYAAASETGVEH